MANNKYIRFDWAAKTVLRDKAHFCILEGLITVLQKIAAGLNLPLEYVQQH